MEIKYNKKANALYIDVLPHDKQQLTTERLNDSIAVDKTSDGTIVGIEILNIDGSEVKFIIPTGDVEVK